MLMAAALLISTNAGADVTTASQFYSAWATSGDVTITLGNNISLNKTLWLGTTNDYDEARKVVINLNGYQLSTSAPYGFLLTHGTLEINGLTDETHGESGSKIVGTGANELFFVTGAANPAKENFTNLKIGKGVWVDYSTYKAAISVDEVTTTGQAYKAIAEGDSYPTKGQLTYNTHIYTEKGKGAAFGVNVEVAGKITATRYAVKTNGSLGFEEATKDKTPYVHICSTADIYVPATGQADKKPLALYASGYARWLIEGTVQGNVGVLVKSGEVEINGATISSNNTQEDSYYGANESNSGSMAAGSAVVISSEKAYSGDIDVTITGESTLIAGDGYALDESVATPSNGSKVDGITIEGATFVAGTTSAGAVTISETTTVEATNPGDETTIIVTSAVIEGTVTIAGNNSADPNLPEGTVTLNNFSSTSAYFPSTDPDVPSVVVPLNIKLNGEGYATYSAPHDLYLPSGLTAYVGAINLNRDQLVLEPVNYIAENQGVVLKGTKNGEYLLTTNNALGITPKPYPANDLKPSTEWANHGENIYVLVVDELWKYTGSEMKPNKAYLDLGDNPSAKGAPKRISLKAEETQAVDNVETTIEAVKFMENGQIYIRRGENIYNVQGQIVK